MIGGDNLIFIVLFGSGMLLVLVACALLLLGRGRQAVAPEPSEAAWRDKAAAFKREVRAYFEREGWTLTAYKRADFNAARGIVRLSVLLGPRIFDARFIAIPALLSEKIHSIIRSYTKSTPNILVIVEPDSLPFFQEFKHLHTSIIPIDKLDYLKYLGRFALDDRDEGESWALSMSRMNPDLCRQLSKDAMQAGNAALAREWAECAADAGPANALAQHNVAGFRLKAGELNAAAAAAARAVLLAPADLPFRRRLSIIELQRGNLAQAIEHGRRIAQSETSQASDFHHLAGIYIRASQWDLAEEAQQRALAIQPGEASFQKRLTEIRQKRAQRGVVNPR